MFLSDKKNHKAIFDYKRAYVLSKRLGLELLGVDFDLLLATYILNPSAAKEEFKGIYITLLPDKDIVGFSTSSRLI